MDRGIPTEATLAAMRAGDAPVLLVGTPKGRLTRLEQAFLAQPWQAVRPSVTVKLLAEEGELYILVRSAQRRLKERGMRRRRLKTLWQRLGELQQQTNTRDQLLRSAPPNRPPAGPGRWSTSACPPPARRSPRRPSPSACGGTGSGRPAGGRAATCCART